MKVFAKSNICYRNPEKGMRYPEKGMRYPECRLKIQAPQSDNVSLDSVLITLKCTCVVEQR